MILYDCVMKRKTTAFIAIVSASFVLSLVLWMMSCPGIRYVFMFQSAATGKICMESRYLPRRPVQGKVNCYVDELLLGPLTAEYRPLFTRGTRAQSCFVRGGVLYVDLSDALVSQADGASEIQQGMELFRKNILYNFKNIHTIEVFVAGNHAYEKSAVGDLRKENP